jgi:ABC-2 type transport system ATP-binding protein
MRSVGVRCTRLARFSNPGAVHGGRSVFNHLLCLAQSNGIGRARVEEALALVGLQDVGRRRARGLSLGMSQRLGLAAALLGNPQVLLCDEPVNGLDPEGIHWIRHLLRDLAAQGRTVFVSSHLMSEMALTADHVIVVGRGRLIADASVAEIVAQSAQGYVLVRTPHLARLEALVRGSGGTSVRASDGAMEVSVSPVQRSATWPPNTASPCTSCLRGKPPWKPRTSS